MAIRRAPRAAVDVVRSIAAGSIPFDEFRHDEIRNHAGRVPVVLVHGTASSPARWAELVNELSSDPVIQQGCQFWFFSYNTGNPVTFSAGKLREDLRMAVAELDPEGRDPALHRIVVIGHSQGGLLAKLTVGMKGVVIAVGSTGMAVAAILGLILDNLVPGTPEQRGLKPSVLLPKSISLEKGEDQ